MASIVQCDCGIRFKVALEHAGKQLRCKCGQLIPVPAAQPSAAVDTTMDDASENPFASDPFAQGGNPFDAPIAASPNAPESAPSFGQVAGAPGQVAPGGATQFQTTGQFQSSPQFQSPVPAQTPGGVKPEARAKSSASNGKVLKIVGIVAGSLVGVAILGGLGFMVMSTGGPTIYATPEACYERYQWCTKRELWAEQFDLVTPEAQNERLLAAARSALPWCKHGPELVEMFDKHGIPDIAGKYKEWETAYDNGDENSRALIEAIEQQVVTAAQDRPVYYEDLIKTIEAFEERYESNMLMRAGKRKEKRAGRDLVTKNRIHIVLQRLRSS